MKHYPVSSGIRGTRKPNPTAQPDRPGRLLQQARNLLFDRRTEEALDTCDRALKLMPRVVELLCVRAGSLLDLGYPELALAHLDSAIDMDPNNGDLTVERCRAYIELGNLSDAREDLTMLHKNFMEDPEVIYLLAIVEELSGDFKEADRLFEIAETTSPDRYVAPIRVPSDWLQKEVQSIVREIHQSIGEQLETLEARVLPIPPEHLWAGGYQGVPPTVLGILTGNTSKGEELVPVNTGKSVQFLIFQRNLERMVRSRDMLLQQLRSTIEHELRVFMDGQSS